MRLRLKTKITLIIALLVLAVVGVTSWLHVMTLTRQVIQQADRPRQPRSAAGLLPGPERAGRCGH